MAKNSNTPDLSRWDRFKKSVERFQYRHDLHRPQPIKRIKNTDPRLRNFLGAAGIAGVGATAALLGAVDYVQSNDIVHACNKPGGEAKYSERLCDAARDTQKRDVNMMFGGAVTDIVVVGGAVYMDGRLKTRQIQGVKPPVRSLTR